MFCCGSKSVKAAAPGSAPTPAPAPAATAAPQTLNAPAPSFFQAPHQPASSHHSAAATAAAATSVGVSSHAAAATSPALPVPPPIVPTPGLRYIVTASVIQAKNLRAADARTVLRKATSDPYCKAFVKCSDGSTTPVERTRHLMRTLNPVWNERIEFALKERQVPVAITFELFDHDKVSEDDPLGELVVPLGAPDVLSLGEAGNGAVSKPVREHALAKTSTGSLQFQVVVQEVDPSDETGALRIAAAERVGMITLKIKDVTNFAPGPLAIKALGADVLRSGEYTVRAVVQYGLRNFRSAAKPGAVLPELQHALVKPGITGAEAARTVPGPTLAFDQACKIWVQKGEERYMMQCTLYLVGTKHDPKTGRQPVAALGRGFAAVSALQDGLRHAFHVHLREESERDMELTDAEQNMLLQATSPRPGSAWPASRPPRTMSGKLGGFSPGGTSLASTSTGSPGGAGGAGGAGSSLSARSPLEVDDGSGFAPTAARRLSFGGTGHGHAHGHGHLHLHGHGHGLRTASEPAADLHMYPQTTPADAAPTSAATPATAPAASPASAAGAGASAGGAGAGGASSGAGATPSARVGESNEADDASAAEARRLLDSGAMEPEEAAAPMVSGLEATGKGPVTGCLILDGALQSKDDLETWFFRQMLKQFDEDGSGALDRAEMLAMVHTLGAKMSTAQLGELLDRLDANKDGKLDASELLAWFRSPDFSSRPMAYSLLAFLADGVEGLHNLVSDVSRAVSSAKGRETSAGAAILAMHDGLEDRQVFVESGLRLYNRATGLIMTEHVPPFILTALQLMYESSIGAALASTGAVRRLLRNKSAAEGAAMNKPESKAKIVPFIREHSINMAECRIEDPAAFPHFNAFFARELKVEARPIAAPHDDGVVVSPADCRLIVFPTITDATAIWVKGAKFTVESLLGPSLAEEAKLFVGGALCIARLAPQDYHRWHLPVTGRLVKRVPIDGALYTVNPIAIRRAVPDVYTENKREVWLIQTRRFGLVALIAVGATIVGSINTVIPEGSFARKGECHGFFAFGGSTTLVLFQRGTVAWDSDLAAYAKGPLETYVRVGEGIGRAVAPDAPHPGALPADDPDYAVYAAAAAVAAGAGAVETAAAGAADGSTSSRPASAGARASAIAASLAVAASEGGVAAAAASTAAVAAPAASLEAIPEAEGGAVAPAADPAA